MTEGLHLAHAPIVEAVLDINCDLPPNTDLSDLQERAKAALSSSYPNARRLVTQRHEFGISDPESQPLSRQLTGLRFLTEDEKQVVQFRGDGYSFNRLAPYGKLDDYLGDIEWSWNIFRELVKPVQVRGIGLRFINRILLPVIDGNVDLKQYLRVSPQLPDEETLAFVGFLNQHAAVEIATGNHVNITLMMESRENDALPVILDIETWDPRMKPVEEWEGIREAILSLRRLTNRVFARTLTETCLNLFRQP